MRGAEFAELRAFMEVAEHGNFGRAATRLGLAPSTLSQTIRALETRLETRLLHRSTRSVSLTEAGRHLLERIRPAFGELEAAVESINAFRAVPSGNLRLSISTVPAQMILAPLLRDFLHAYPGIRLEIEVDRANVDIVKGGFDAGIRYGSYIARDMVVMQVSPPTRMLAVASPGYLQRHSAPTQPHELRNHDCIRLRSVNRQTLVWEFEQAGRRIEVDVEGPLLVNDADLLVRAVCDGIGIGYMAEAYMREHLLNGSLVPLLADWAVTMDGWFLYYASRHHLPAPLKAFIQFLRDRQGGGGELGRVLPG